MEDDPFHSSGESDSGRRRRADRDRAREGTGDGEGEGDRSGTGMEEDPDQPGKRRRVDRGSPSPAGSRGRSGSGSPSRSRSRSRSPSPRRPPAGPPSVAFTLPVLPPQRYTVPTGLLQLTAGKQRLLDRIAEDDGLPQWGTLCSQLMKGSTCAAGPQCAYLHITREGWREKQLWTPGARRVAKSQGLYGADGHLPHGSGGGTGGASVPRVGRGRSPTPPPSRAAAPRSPDPPSAGAVDPAPAPRTISWP